MKTRKAGRILISLLLVLVMALPVMTGTAAADDTSIEDQISEAYDSATVLTFSDTADDSGNYITSSSASATGYSISGRVLTITAAGVYRIAGSCSDGMIEVKKSLSNVFLVLDGLDLTSTSTGYAPIVVKSGASATIYTKSASALTDNESDTSSEDFEGAAIKVKSGAKLYIRGTSSAQLSVNGTAKNGIKGAATSAIYMRSGLVKITAANNGLAADGMVTISGGTLNITAGNEGIKSEPEDGDTESAGAIYICGSPVITIDTITNKGGDGIQATNDITIDGTPTLTIKAYNDGIQSNGDLAINGGTFTINTYSATNSYNYNSAIENADISAKGLKASASDDDTEDATNQLTITGGDFSINTADDAIHSDGYATITGGYFDIYTGDDGVHADTSLVLGSSSGKARDPYIKVNQSYEGLESGTVYIYGGKYYVYATDDGINAAGGSSSGTDPGGPNGSGNSGPGGGSQGGNDHFNPGGGFGGRTMGLMATSSYSLNIAGGEVYVNCYGDGLDSNGDLTLTGGNIEVWSQSSGDNEPLDYDGSFSLGSGLNVFAAGCAGMGQASPSSYSQSYVNRSTSISSNAVVNVTSGSTTVFRTKAPKAASYEFISLSGYSSPTVSSSSGSASCSSSINLCGSQLHSFNSGSVTKAATASSTGLRTYTCTVCGETETQTLPMLVSGDESADDTVLVSSSESTDEGFTVSFTVDSGVSGIDVYYTQDYTSADETDVTSTVSRDGDSGNPDSTGSGQVNFLVRLNSGYNIESVAVSSGSYKNIKGSSDTGVENLYRITKIASALVVDITTTEEPDEGYTVTYTTDANTSLVTYKGQTENVETSVAESSTATGVSYDGDTGEPDSTGSGQVNFVATIPHGYTPTVEVTAGTYNNIKLVSSDTSGTSSDTYTYRVTKITADTAVSVSASQEAEAEATSSDYYATFSGLENATVYTYKTQTVDTSAFKSGAENTWTSASTDTTTYARDTTGTLVTESAAGQVNFAVVPAEGYTISSVVATPTTNYTNLKTVELAEDGSYGVYRITKLTGAVAVAITLEKESSSTDSEEDTGYVITFDTDEKATIAVFATQDVTADAVKTISSSSEDKTDYSRDGSTGAALSDGTGQTNFSVTVPSGYYLDSLTATDGTYNNIKQLSYSTDGDGATTYIYRITKITAATTVTVRTASGSDAGYEVTFLPDSHAAIYVYKTQDVESSSNLVKTVAGGATTDNTDVSRDGSTGEPDSTGAGQVNMLIIPDSGYIVSSVTATSGLYSNIKYPDDLGVDNAYRVTKITGALEIAVATEEDPGFKLSFDNSASKATISIYSTSATSGTVVATVTAGASGTDYSRDGSTGAKLSDGTGQSNFTISVPSGYGLDSLSATEGTYGELKLIGTDEGSDATVYTYRLTKITADSTISISTSELSYTATFYTTGGSASVSLYESASGETVSASDVTSATAASSGSIYFGITPASGYEISAVTKTASSGGSTELSATNGIYSITGISEDFNIYIVLSASSESGGGTTPEGGSQQGPQPERRDVPDGEGGTRPEDIPGMDDVSGQSAKVYFYTNGHASINVYQTVSSSNPEEQGVWVTYARSGDTGAVVDVSTGGGRGQVTFAVVVDEGYSLDYVTGSNQNYKSLKALNNGIENCYQITQITGDTAITINTSEAGSASGSISLNTSSTSVQVGKSITLKATVAPADSFVSWSSSNTNVAAVSPSGVVTGVREGLATITAKISVDGTSYTAKANVEVTAAGSTGGGGGGSSSSGGSTTVVDVTTEAEAEATEETEEGTTENARKAAERFIDVDENNWAADAIGYVVEKGYFNGTSQNTFTPAGDATREQVMTILARYAGETGATIEEGVAWAVENGVSDGSARLEAITREQFVTMLYRLIGEPEVEGNEALGFTDGNTVSAWAGSAMEWAVENGIIEGYEDGSLKPQAKLTRAQMAAVMQRVDEKGIEAGK